MKTGATMDETLDNKPHVNVLPDAPPPGRGESLSIWFFCGILTLGYGIVLLAQATLEHFRGFGQQPPATVLANLHPTFWWGVLLFVFGAFYTVRFRPGKG
jgi:hypothetical protein